MHVPDGFINAPVSVAAAAVAVGGLAVVVKKANDDYQLESQAALTGLVAAFIFAGQMLNFPVAGGTSGHLLGGLLAAVLVGPWLGSLAVSVVLIVQTFLFADGGVTALGLNIIIMAFIPTFVAYGLFLLLRRALPQNRRGVLSATAIAALASVVIASVAFVAAYAVGGNGAVELRTAVTAMVGVHFLIGLGEAFISTLTVGAVLSSRPDLVFGARDLDSRQLQAALT